MAIVTVSREFGSAGSEVARKIAELLGYHLVDKGVIGRILAGYGLVEFDQAYEAESGIWSAFDTRQRTMVDMLERVSLAVARHGHSVILGRGSYIVLSEAPGVLNVRIRAPFEWRVARIIEEGKVPDRATAEEAVREGDRIRASFVSALYGMRWDSMEHFDLVIDTSKMGIDVATALIVEGVKSFPADELRTNAESPDPILDEALAAELRCEPRIAGNAKGSDSVHSP